MLNEIYSKLVKQANKDVCNDKYMVSNEDHSTDTIRTFLLAFVVESLGVCAINDYPNISCQLEEYKEPCEDCGVVIDFVEWEADTSDLEDEWIEYELVCLEDETEWLTYETCCLLEEEWVAYSVCCLPDEEEWLPYEVCCLQNKKETEWIAYTLCCLQC